MAYETKVRCICMEAQGLISALRDLERLLTSQQHANTLYGQGMLDGMKYSAMLLRDILESYSG